MLVVAMVSIVAMFILLIGFIYLFERFREICKEKDLYIEILEDEIKILEDYIEQNRGETE